VSLVRATRDDLVILAVLPSLEMAHLTLGVKGRSEWELATTQPSSSASQPSSMDALYEMFTQPSTSISTSDHVVEDANLEDVEEVVNRQE